ncbi:Cytochrome P450 [Mycena kentingensis (nom. inval.)]|nr:Cytochrome P450 [Mycena kentingensis (nom. inval.)]
MSLVTALLFFAKLLAALVSLLLLRGIVWLVNLLVIAPLRDPLRNLPGPDGGAFETHFSSVNDPDITPEVYHSWTARFGKTFRYNGFGRHDYRLMSFDLRVLTHVLSSPQYVKPWQTRSFLRRLLGRGVFTMEGSEHRVLRKLIGPVFTQQAVKNMAPIFFQKSEELCDRWDALIASSSDSPATLTLDVSHWVSRTTFDIFGLAGLDYHFNALLDESEAVYSAYRTMFAISDRSSQMRVLKQLYLPIIERIWPDEADRTTQRCLKTIRDSGMALIQAKRQAMLAEKIDFHSEDKDVLSLLIKANLATDSASRLSDQDLLDQLSSFLFAGSDSTALTITWCLRFLSLYPEMQQRLRDEILESGASASRIVDALDALPYLDAIVHETLRFCPPVHGTIRTATTDDLIPISSSVTLRDGTVLSATEHIPIRRGTFIHIPIEGVNMSEDIWGPDARVYNPERWLPSSSSEKRAPGPAQPFPGLANVLTFSFGRSSCPGWRFALLQAKIVLAALVRQYAFEPVPGAEIGMYNSVLTKPFVRKDGRCASEGVELPLRVSRVRE